MLRVSLLSDLATLPTRGSDFAAGLDLYTPREVVVSAHDRVLVPLDIAIQLPKHTFGHVLPRSGLAVKKGIHVGAGVIDEDYRGNVGVLLFNLSNETVTFSKGDRIAQLVVKPYVPVEIEQVDESKLDESDRNQGGFGSSGK
jgi:dUTP pyrophosphatase